MLSVMQLFELFSVPFEWEKTRVRAFIFAELIFGCPNYTLIFALPLQLGRSSLPETPVLVTSLKAEILTQIFSFLPIKDICNFSSVNKQWNFWIVNNEKLWKNKNEEMWEIPPIDVLHETVGWHVVTVLKRKRETVLKKGFCTKINEFELDLAKLVRFFKRNSELADRLFSSPGVSVLRDHEVEEFACTFTEIHFEEVQGTLQKLYLNNLKFYFLSCAKLKQPMFVLNLGDQ